MNNILRCTSRAKLINSLVTSGRTDDPVSPGMFEPDVLFGIIVSDSRLDDELSVASIEFSDTPTWLQHLNQDPCGFPKKTLLGTIWKGVDANAQDNHGQTEFIRAVIEGTPNLHYAEMLAEFSDTDVNIRDKQGRTALHWACAGNLSEMVMLCLSVPECEIGLMDNEGRTAFDIALQNTNSHETIPILFYTSIFEMENSDPQTALLRVLTITSEPAEDKRIFPGAAMFGPVSASNVALVKALVARGIDYKVRDEHGDTALHVAVKVGIVEIANILMEGGADVNARGNKGATPLHYATDCDNRMMVRTLLRRDANPNVRDDAGRTSLDLAEKSQEHDLVVLLKGVKVVYDMDGERVEVVERLVVERLGEMVPVVDLECRGVDGLTALLKAVLQGDLVNTQILLELGANIEATDDKQQTSLHLAARRGHLEILNKLLACGAQVEATSKGGTALHLASKSGHKESVRTLLDSGALIEAARSDKRRSLHQAVRYGQREVVIVLLECGANIEATGDAHRRPLHFAALKGYVEITKTLLARGAEVEARDDHKDRALHMAIENGHLHVLQLLLTSGSKVYLRRKSKYRALNCAAHGGHTEMVIALLAAGSDVEEEDGNGYRALHIAASHGHTQTVDVLLSAGAKTKEVNYLGNTPLHLAAGKGHWGVVKSLLFAGARTNAKSRNGNRALHLAAEYGHVEIVRTLISSGAESYGSSRDGIVPLHLAARRGHTEIVELFLETGYSVDSWCSTGTPLQMALENRHESTIKTLVAHGAALEAIWLDEDGLMANVGALELAVKTGQRDIVEMLLTTGVKIEAIGTRGLRPLQMAASGGEVEILEILLAWGAQIEAVGYKDQRALHFAASGGHTEIVNKLLAGGAEVDPPSRIGTPLQLASKNGYTETVQALVAGGAQNRASPNLLHGLWLQVEGNLG